jgi:ribosomal protein S12 methylthiotransferase
MPLDHVNDSAQQKRAAASTTPGSVAFITLGCAKNTVDTEVMHSRLAAAGWRLEPDPERADVTVINTCGFIGPAREESITTILEVAQRQQSDPRKMLVVTGCMVTRYADDLWNEIPEIDLLVDLASFGRIDRLLQEARETGERRRCQGGDTYLYRGRDRKGRLTLPHTTYVKIAEGCNHTCAFCAIPGFKGRFQSRPAEDIVAEVRALVADGVKELNFISQDTSFYGVDLGGRRTLPRLLQRIAAEVEGDYWLRLLYLYPTEVDAALLEEIATNPRVLPYVDIPLQHAAGTVLQAMGRGQDGERLRRLIGEIRGRIPGVAIRTTMLVGFPTEGEAEFRELEAFVGELRFDNLGVFTYSLEEGTPAEGRGDPLPQELKDERRDRLMALQEGVSAELNAARVGSRMRVLVDRAAADLTIARAALHAPEIDGHVRIARRPGAAVPRAGSFVDVEIIDADIYDLDAVSLAAAE